MEKSCDSGTQLNPNIGMKHEMGWLIRK